MVCASLEIPRVGMDGWSRGMYCTYCTYMGGLVTPGVYSRSIVRSS